MPKPATGRTPKGSAKREAILEAALAVFGEVGLHGASLREIASRVGVSHQSLMHYFPTKNELLMAVLRRRDERLRRHFDDEGGMSISELISLGRGDQFRAPRARLLRRVLRKHHCLDFSVSAACIRQGVVARRLDR